MIHYIYILTIIILSIIIVIYYYLQEADYKKEIEKIDRLETIKRRETKELDMIRSQSIPCPYGNFRSPRSCYFDSGYSCTWNDLAQQCDAKI